jgi:hypothetical protein
MARKSKHKTARQSSKGNAPVRLTGGAGFRFENLIAARFLLDMLTGKNSLGVDFGRVARVDWQARDAGWLLDDLTVACRTLSSDERVGGFSIKSYQQLGNSGFNSDFARPAWQQWLDRDTTRHFRRGADALVLATGELSATVQRAWSALHREATQASAERVAARLAKTTRSGSQSSALQRAIFGSLRRPSEFGTGNLDPAVETIVMIRDIQVLKFDFEMEPSSDRVEALLDCQASLSSGSPEEANTLWTRMIEIADGKRAAGGSLDLPGLLAQLRGQFRLTDHSDFRKDWEVLVRRSIDNSMEVSTSIGGTAYLPREAMEATILGALATKPACVLLGESGSGKSALAKQLATSRYARFVWLSPEDVDKKSNFELERGIGLSHPIVDVLRASGEPCLFVLDGAEGYTENGVTMTARILRELLSKPGTPQVQVLITVQFEGATALVRRLLRLEVPEQALTTVTVERPTEEEITALFESLPQLNWIALRPDVRPLLTNLKVLDLTARTIHSETALGRRPLLGLTTLIDILWMDWIEGGGGDRYGRSHVLQTVAIHEAETLSSGIPRRSLGYAEQQALSGLTTSGILRVKDERVSFTHNLLSDWSRMTVLVGDNPTAAAFGKRAESPHWHKAIRLFGQRILEQGAEDTARWRSYVENVSAESGTSVLVRDLFLESLFLAANPVPLLERAWATLVSSDGLLLRRLLDRFLFVATLPDSRLLTIFGLEDASLFEHAFRIPYWPYWAPVLTTLNAHRDDVAKHAPYETARLCALWLRAMPFELAPGQPMPWRREAAELAVAIAREIQTKNEEGSYFSAGSDQTVYEALLYGAKDLPAEVTQLSLELARRRPVAEIVSARAVETRRKRAEERRKSVKETRKAGGPVMPILRGPLREPWPDGPSEPVDHDFQDACLKGMAFVNLVQANPDAAVEVLLAVCIEAPQHEEYQHSSLREDTGLAYLRGHGPAIYTRGPFLQFLSHAPEQGLSFVLRLVNFATKRYVGDDAGMTVEVEGKQKLWRGDARVFRWHHDWPLSQGEIIHSVLMALEKWLYDEIDAGHDVDRPVRRIVAESESLAFAGLLFDAGKKAPQLFAGPLKPLFSTWRLWRWDFEVTTLRLSGHTVSLGFWGNQPKQLIVLAREWYAMPHRKQHALTPDGAIPRTMLSKPEFREFFEEIRRKWATDVGDDAEDMRALVERINPDNYAFPPPGTDGEIEFQWPEALAREHDERLRELELKQSLSTFPFQCRKALDAGKPLPAGDLAPLFQWLQDLDAHPPQLPAEDGEPLHPLETIILGAIALLVVLHLDWLLEEPNRISWCRAKLKAVLDNPPKRTRFDSEGAVGIDRWDAFAAESGVRLLVSNSDDALARRLVAEGVMAFHYSTTGLTMRRAFGIRQQIGDDFQRLTTLSVHWAALRVLGPYSLQPERADHQEWITRKATLLLEFVNRTNATALPDLKALSKETSEAFEELQKKRNPDFYRPRAARPRSGKSESHEKLYPERMGLNWGVIMPALGWLDPGAAATADERTRLLHAFHSLLQLTLSLLPELDDPEHQEIEGVPGEFEGWVFGLLARAIPQLRSAEAPESLWKPIFDLGAPGHDWVERFFWSWFTDGFRAAKKPEDFLAIWRSMIFYAAANPRWDISTYASYRLDGMVIELLGLDGRWTIFGPDAAFAPTLGTMVDVFSRAAELWFQMPRVVRYFLQFVVQPAAAEFLRPAILWLAGALAQYSTYDWRDGIENGLVEFLEACWKREHAHILSEPETREAYFALLTSVISRGGHAAIALRDRIAASAGI